jgi:2-C-methyl-D-erythritol 2,4-cyclodiphosphate synthase
VTDVGDPVIRVGLGFDVHPTEVGRVLHLGGIRIDDAPGLAGHSDGDVVCHALADAILGAAGLGDLGSHFPDSDPATEGIAGLSLLGRVVSLAREAGFAVSTCDLTVIADKPAIAPIADAMKDSLAPTLGAATGGVSVKATRPEGLGLAGDGVGCIAIVMLTSVP